ncbi:MAG TPA: universal stress protein [Longimicrobiales bacterium]|nr:universal stress protein [Longimicrobiales bacterium]
MRLLTLKSVLVATDLDAASRPAIQTAARLAPLAGASLYLLHASGEPSDGGVEKLVESFRLAAPEAGEPDDSVVITGFPATVIVQHARAVGADVVVLGPHRERGAARPLGSTAASVVRAAPCPCLVAAAELRLPLERVLVAVDDSDAAREALEVAMSWASALRPRGAQATLMALHVAPPAGSQDATDAIHRLVEEARDHARDYARVDVTERVVPGSDPAKVILQEAAAAKADLLVIGTRAAQEVPPELGSVSAAVAQATSCPLLLVPPPGHRRPESD